MSSRSAWGLIVRFEPAWHTATLSPVDDLEDLLFMDLRSLRSWICDHSNQAGRPAVRDLIIRELLIDRGYGPGVWPGDHLDSRGGGIGMSAGAGPTPAIRCFNFWAKLALHVSAVARHSFVNLRTTISN